MLFAPPPGSSIGVALVHEDGSQSELGIILHWYDGAPARRLILTQKDHDGKIVEIVTQKISDEEISYLVSLLTSKP